MKDSSKGFVRFHIFPAICLVAIGLLVNQWLLAYMFASTIGGGINLENKIFIWIFQVFCIGSGLLIYSKGGSVEGRRQLVFTVITVVFMVLVIEGGLHIANFVLRLGGPEKIVDKRYLLSPYRGKEWAEGLFKEFSETFREYEQFLGWDRREYHGKYINIDSNGLRKTWNPEDFDGKTPDTIYMFGGSTVWGTGARDDYTMPSYLSRMLNSSGYDVFVFNYGEGGYTFTQEIIHLILLLKDGHRPDYVVCYDGINDVYGAYQAGVAGVIQNVSIMREKLEAEEPTPMQHVILGVRGMFRDHCMINKAIKKIARNFRKEEKFQEVAAKYSDEEILLLAEDAGKYYMESMALLERLSQVYGFEYVCFWQPVIFMGDKLIGDEMEVDPRLGDETLANIYKYTTDFLVAKSLSRFFNISNVLNERTKPYYIDIGHLSEEGNEMVTAKIVDIFKKEFLLNE